MTHTYEQEIIDALKDVPDEIAQVVMDDINQRITDWLASGGKHKDTYIRQQVKYAQNVGKKYGVEANEG